MAAEARGDSIAENKTLISRVRLDPSEKSAIYALSPVHQSRCRLYQTVFEHDSPPEHTINSRCCILDGIFENCGTFGSHKCDWFFLNNSLPFLSSAVYVFILLLLVVTQTNINCVNVSFSLIPLTIYLALKEIYSICKWGCLSVK